ncbi:hypothetical protein GCM10009808_10150 [Microbacterium sediminicola]|uniref:histidine kinase n=1 Tax=Microbacterium sediminicola TaxID=415210 RepID=A0ABP4TZQ4_9MICO
MSAQRAAKNPPPTGEEGDRRRVQRAALAVGAWVAAASALVITIGVGILVALILARARVESDEAPGSGGHHGGDGDVLVVDVDNVLPWVIGLGLIGVIVLSLVAWYAARRSVRPLSDALRLQRNFVADASHELRTPLTTLTSRIQVAQLRLERGGDVAEALERLRTDAATMNDVLTDLLLAAEGAHDTSAVTDVAAGVAAAVTALQPLADGAGVTITSSAESVAVRMPEATFTRVLVAVLDNAIQHSPADGTVSVSAASERGALVLRISDQGPGVDAGDVERIFERFARARESGKRRGFGLGLALVRDILARYGGRIEVASTSPAGTTFAITLPSAR